MKTGLKTQLDELKAKLALRKITFEDEKERRYFQMMPLKFRKRHAFLFNQPELVPPDGRTQRSVKLKSERIYVVRHRFHPGKKTMTLTEAAAEIGFTPQELEASLNECLAQQFNRGKPTVSFQVDNDEVTVTRG